MNFHVALNDLTRQGKALESSTSARLARPRIN